MSRSADRVRGDGGFTLVEIIVALGILMIVMTALLPQLVVGIRSTGTARAISQAKGVAQGQLDRMRNLPFRVSPAAGDYRDVLDFYYRNLASGSTPTCTSAGTYVTPQPSWAGYVSATDARCDYEPTGAFYRYIDTVAPSGTSGGFTVVVDTQFLSGATPPQPVTPPTGYDTQTTGKDNPASTQIGITVTVLYSTRGTVRPISTYTQLAEQPSATTRVRAEGGATTLEVGSVTVANGSVSLSSGLLNLVGSLTYASTVTANLIGTSAGLATGEKASGASAMVAAPPSLSAATITSGNGSLSTTGCSIACWGSTRLDRAAMSADQGLPNAGSVSAPMQALLSDSANNGVSFGNSSSNDYRAGLNLAPPLLRLDPDAVPAASGTSAGCALGGAGPTSYVTASGYLRTTAATDATSPSTVESCVVARASSISLFPTDFAPRGVVLVELRRASARCLVSGAGHTPSAIADYEAVVKYFNGSGYTTAATITQASGTDPLDTLDLAATSVGGGGKVLGDYIASWSALTASEIIRAQETGRAELRLPGIVTIASQPVRPGTVPLDPTIPTSPQVDPTSVVSVTLGALSCSAQDLR